jgi:phosphatidylserine/phosphatidylglycerophosphate/cardiolipin synthase-like enzyme
MPDLIRADIELYEYVGPKKTLNAKVAIIDEDSDLPIFLIGSFNFDRRSSMLNRESGIMVTGKDIKVLVNQAKAIVANIQSNSVLSAKDGQKLNTLKIESQANPGRKAQLMMESLLANFMKDHI